MEIDHIQVQVSDAGGDVLKPEQPAKGWKGAEQALAGYSKTNAKKTPQSRWNYKNKAKKEDAANALLKQEYGDISRFFSPAPKPSSKTDAPMARQQLPPLRPTSEAPMAPPLRPTSEAPMAQQQLSTLRRTPESLAPQRIHPPPGWAPTLPPVPCTPIIDFENAFFATTLKMKYSSWILG